MIGESGTSIIGNNGLTPLATELNKLGWVTISLPAPETAFTLVESDPVDLSDTQASKPEEDEKPQIDLAITEKMAVPPIESNSTKSAVSGLDATASIKHEKELIALLQASATKASEYPGFFLVIAQGTSAAWMTKIYAEKKLETPDALVVISPFWPDRKFNESLPILMANTPMPVLDLYSKKDNEWALKTVSDREVSAVKALKLQYRQRELLGYNFSEQNSLSLSKEIYGWTTHMGW